VDELWIRVGPGISLTLYRTAAPGLSVEREYALARTLAYRVAVEVAPPSAAASPPTIAGTAQVGQLLDGSPGDWSLGPVQFTYAWLRCDASAGRCSSIPGVHYPAYTVTTADRGATLELEVTAISPSGSRSARSAPTAVVQ
jgi:hypothetical protein